MFKLVQITPFSDLKHLKEILELFFINKSLIFFNDFENVQNIFWNDLYSNSIIIASIDNNSVFGVVVLKRIERISNDKFLCYMFGAAKRGYAKELTLSLNYIFSDLKKHGFLAIRIETLSSNRAMRSMANRLGFRRVGELKAVGMRKNKLLSSILYEKVL